MEKCLGALVLVILLSCPAFVIAKANEEGQMNKDRIQINSNNPRYWEYIAGTLRVSDKNPRYFTDESGRAIYLTGSHTWANLQELKASPDTPNFDYEASLDFMQEHNHNFMRMWIWEQAAWTPNTNVKVLFEPLPYLRTGPGNALDGKPKFDLRAFNENYFSRLRSRVMEAGRRGIYVSIMLFEGFSICDKDKKDKGNPWSGHPLNAKNNINGFDGDPDGDGQGHEIHTLGVPVITELQEAYVRKVVDTVNDLDNVLYEVANEDHGGATEWQYHIIDFIHNYEADKAKQHPVLMTFQWDPHHIGNNADLFRSPAEAISPNHEGGYRNNPPAADGTKVIISDTDHLWGIGGDRAWVWKTFCRGMNPIFMDPMGPQPGNGAELPNPNDKPEFESIRRAMGHTLSYANRMDLINMVPRNDLSASRYCLADPGKEYLIYLPDGGEVIVDLSSASGTFTVEWFNPETGEAISSEAISGGKSERIVAPFSGDTVLYIRKTGHRDTQEEDMDGKAHVTHQFEWQTATPESQGISSQKLDALRKNLAMRNTKALLVIRNDRIVYEWYAPGHSVNKQHYTASMAKALVGGVCLAVAVSDGRIGLDDQAAEYILQWKDDLLKSKITVRHLGSHTSGIEDAEADNLPHEKLTGWKGDFWKRLEMPSDPFSISRDRAPVLFEPGTGFQYSNPGIAMLSYAITAALREAPEKDLRTVLRDRIMRPIGVPDKEWSAGYGQVFTVDDLPLVATWGGGGYTARALARVGRLMLRKGDWEGAQLISEEAVRLTTSSARLPGENGMGWWTNADGRFSSLPKDTFWASGAGHQTLLVVPSLNLICVRNGGPLNLKKEVYREVRGLYLFKPLMDAITDTASGNHETKAPSSM